jgi:dipeptidyl aminopeptidase/acylaminoacyl peptidase
MRPRRWVLALILFTLIASVAPAQARPLPNNVIVIDPAEDPPPNLLLAEEVERIERLQGAAFPLPFSPVSPNDESVLLISDEDLGLLDLVDGTTRLIDPGYFERFVPLPLLGFSSFSWLDAETLGVLALDLDARSPDDALVRLYIDRVSAAVDFEPLRIPPEVGIISVAPDLRQMLVVLPPEDENGDAAEQARAVGVRMALPQVGGSDPEPRPIPAALRRSVAAARVHPALTRLWGWQEEEEDLVAATPRTLDLALISANEPGLRYVTTVPEASVLISETWSADSRKLAFSLYGLADSADSRPRFDGARFSDEYYRDATGNLPPTLSPFLQRNDTYLVEVANGATHILRPDAEAAPPLLAAHNWAPDGASLLVRTFYPARLKGRTHPIYNPQFSERGSFRIYDSRTLREIGRLESNLFSAGLWSNVAGDLVSPDEVIFRASGVNRPIYYWNRASGELRNLADRAGSYFNVFSTNQSREVVFTHTSYSTPPDVYRMGWDGKGLARLTWQNEELRLLADLREDVVRFRLPGGVVREGVLIQPAAAPFPPRDTRIIVWQEGGPGPAMNNRWDSIVERPFALLPGMGFALLVTPVAGRPGYTPASFNSLAAGSNFGAIDIDEQAAIARELIRRGWTSQGKLGITGCSYGGYFALQSVIRHPNLYAAANPQCGFIDVVTEWTRGFVLLAPYMMGLPPYEIPDEYRRDSPAYNANRIKAAVLTFHGTEDFLPIVQNENLHLQLINRGVPARMLRFVGEGHGLTSEDSQRYAAQEQVRWFRLHLR